MELVSCGDDLLSCGNNYFYGNKLLSHGNGIKLDLRIGEPMQVCIHQKDNSPVKASEPSFDLEGGAKGQI